MLTIILDTNPHAWALLNSELPLSKVVANLLVFINAHIAINHANKVAVVASHTHKAQFLYPTPTLPKSKVHKGQSNGDKDIEMQDADSRSLPSEDANKYRPFAHIERAITTNLRSLISSTSASDLSTTPSTMISGALTMALTYISKQTLSSPSQTSNSANYGNAAGTFTSASADGTTTSSSTGLTSRILIVSVSGDLASQYISIMNTIFACQRLHIPIDILKLAGDTVFLQQAADATGGIYIAPSADQRKGVLQYLMMAYLPDQSAREHLILPGEGEGVDFRAACFCHRKVVDIGFVCSICLSIFCEPLEDNECLTCGTALQLANYGTKPVVVPRKKKKKKKIGGAETPISGPDTPGG